VVWVAIGFIFDLGEPANGQSIYLVIGIPLTIVFQLFVRQRPLQELWGSQQPEAGGRAVFVPLVVVLLVVPMYLFVRDVDDGAGFVLYDLALFVGAVGAAYAVKQFVDATWRDLGQCLLTAGLIGTLAALDMYANVSTAHPFASPFDAPALRDFFVSLGTYIAAVFVVEEVWFRGALDSYIHHPGENHGIFLSIYWRLRQPRRAWLHARVQRRRPQHPRRRAVATTARTRGGRSRPPRGNLLDGSGRRRRALRHPVVVQRLLHLHDIDVDAGERDEWPQTRQWAER
jgi:hypothetical protein